jgi:hypothetical protein
MKTHKNITFLIIGFIFNTPIIFGQGFSEVEIFNSLLDSLYSIEYCHDIIRPPYYKCCDNDSLPLVDFVNCCQSSEIPKEYRKYCKGCLNESDLKSLKQIIIVKDSLSKLDLTEHKKYLLSKIPKESDFYRLIKKSNFSIPTISFNSESLQQDNISFEKKSYYDNLGLTYIMGKYNNDFFIGYFSFSRVYFDELKNIGIFHFGYLGSPDCGYEEYILFYRDKQDFKIYKKIMYGVY